MKIVLAITVCPQNVKRIENQLQALKLLKPVNGVEFIPLFVFGQGSDYDVSPHNKVSVNVKEEYALLLQKLVSAYQHILDNYDFDFICKIDDDTLINIDRFDASLLSGKDYVGRMFDGHADMIVSVKLDLWDINKTFHLGSSYLNDHFKFATGDCYFLSKKATQFVVDTPFTVDEIAPEDRMIGYLLKDKPVIVGEMRLDTAETETYALQVTTNGFTIHPIHEGLFSKLVGKSFTEQLKLIMSSPLNLGRRNLYFDDLEKRLRTAVLNFVNSKKTIGLG